MGVEIVDSMPGSGKTTLAFQEMKDNPDCKWVYCSPYLAEVGDGNKKGRIQRALPELSFKSPKAPGKMRSFEALLKQGKNVAISHSLLAGLSQEGAEIIKGGGYRLILDETLQPISTYQDLSAEDVSILLDSERVGKREDGSLEWNYEQFPNYQGRDDAIKRLCDNYALFAPSGNNGLLEVMNENVVTAFDTVKILTFMFEGSIMSSWLKLKGIPYGYVDVSGFYNHVQAVETLRTNLVFMEPSRTIRELHVGASGKYSPGTFSVTWYEHNKQALDTIRRSLTSVSKKLPKSDRIFWTTFKRYEDALQGARYTRPEVRTVDSKKILVSPFVPKNMRASNDYKDYNTCFYCCNIYPHTIIASYLKAHGVSIDRDAFALSEMLQFILRGSLRTNKKMKLLVLSDRMRSLLQAFLNQ